MTPNIPPAGRRIFLMAPPFSQRSAHDIIGKRTASMFNSGGFPAFARDLWPNAVAALMNSGRVPFGRRIFARVIAPVCAAWQLQQIPTGSIAWILGPATPRRITPSLERNLIRKGVYYVFYMNDDWFSIPHLRDAAIMRAEIADMIVVPTPVLQQRVKQEIPGACVTRLEEPIDIDRVKPTLDNKQSTSPVIVWTGNPMNTGFLESMLPVLNELRRMHNFQLRVICKDKPTLSPIIQLEWLQYNYNHESDHLSGCIAGLSPLQDSPYNRAKDVYKTKTYMSAGIPVVGSKVGYQTELIDHGKSGFLCESDNDWIANLSALLNNPSLALRMGSEARNVAVSRFSHDAVQGSWVAAVRSLTSNCPTIGPRSLRRNSAF